MGYILTISSFFNRKNSFFLKGNTVEFCYLKMIDDEIEKDLDTILTKVDTSPSNTTEVNIKLRIHKDEYHQKVSKVLEHIHRGDIYEANFCQEFYAENCKLDPVKAYLDLNEISEPPFATFFKKEHHFLASASPERYLKKEGTKIISQPIKGTAKRLVSEVDDQKIAADLQRDEKERAENIMIVDLVRNDLARTAKKGRC